MNKNQLVAQKTAMITKKLIELNGHNNNNINAKIKVVTELGQQISQASRVPNSKANERRYTNIHKKFMDLMIFPEKVSRATVKKVLELMTMEELHRMK